MQDSGNAALQTVIAAERLRRLGLLASLAFARFVWLYPKYSADQPRDEQGRFAETGDDVDTTGSVVIQRARTGDARIDTVTKALEQKVGEALDQVGEGFGPFHGIQVHAAFATSVREANIPGVTVERPWLLGEPITASLLGSIRTDVALHENEDGTGRAVAAWDVKTGGAVLLPSRAADIRRGLGVGPEVPVIELHGIRGTFIKSRQSQGVEVYAET